jgi:uncharacterized protein (TIGR03067 family)
LTLSVRKWILSISSALDTRSWRNAMGQAAILILVFITGSRGSTEMIDDKTVEQLQGSWSMVSFEINGESVAEDLVKTGRLEVQGDRYTPSLGSNSATATFKIDTTRTPFAIDFTFNDGPQKGKTCKGIYSLEGDILRICRGLTENEDRPSTFAAPADSMRQLVVWNRAKAGPPAAATEAQKAEYSKFEGTWTYESVEIEGKPVPDPILKARKLILKGNEFTLEDAAQPTHGTYEVEVSKSPKTIDVTFTDGPDAGKVSKGLYELDGDTCRVCIGLAEKPRPAGFTSWPNSGNVLEVLKRQKP